VAGGKGIGGGLGNGHAIAGSKCIGRGVCNRHAANARGLCSGLAVGERNAIAQRSGIGVCVGQGATADLQQGGGNRC
jgi:hypothetical protein